MSSSNQNTRWFRGPVAWLLLGTALVRGAVLVAGSDNLARDPDAYRVMAKDWITTGTLAIEGQPTAYRPPLYPLLLGAWGKVFGLAPASIGAMQFLLGVATVALVLCVGKQWEVDCFQSSTLGSGVPCPRSRGHVDVPADTVHA